METKYLSIFFLSLDVWQPIISLRLWHRFCSIRKKKSSLILRNHQSHWPSQFSINLPSQYWCDWLKKHVSLIDIWPDHYDGFIKSTCISNSGVWRVLNIGPTTSKFMGHRMELNWSIPVTKMTWSLTRKW